MVDVVVGDGIVGASCAYHLAAAGRSVMLVDAGLVGRATDAGAGIVSALGSGHSGDEWDDFGGAAAAYYPELAAALTDLGERDHGWARVGQLMAGDDDPDQLLTRARRIVRRFGEHVLGVPEVVGHTEIEQLWPGLRAESAVWLDQVGRVDGRLFREALLGAFRRLGGQIVHGTAALRIDGHRVAVEIAGEPVAADSVVVAAGTWSGQLLSRVGLPGGWIAPQRGQILHARFPGAGRRPIVSGPHRNYLLPFPGDRVVFGATRETGAGFDPVVTVAGQHWLADGAMSLLPALGDAEVIEIRVGLRPVSADGLPVLGSVPGQDNLYLAAGLGSSGLTLGPHAGRVVADAITGAGSGLAAPFRARRFFPETT